MENLNNQIAELKNRISELKVLFKDEPSKVEIFGRMEENIAEYLNAETGNGNGNPSAENTDADFKKAIDRFNQSGK